MGPDSEPVLFRIGGKAKMQLGAAGGPGLGGGLALPSLPKYSNY